jgi:multidrug efflux system membrane fusion protein
MSQNSTNLATNFSLFKNLSIAIIAFILIIVGFFFYQKQHALKPIEIEDKPLLVEVAKAKLHHNVPFYLFALGSVKPQYSVSLRAQVSGRIMKIFFQEGQKVKKNQLLAQIDEKPYKAQVMQAEGQLLKAQANLANARKDLLRYEELWKKKSTSKQILDTQRSLVKQYQAQIKIDQANLDTAKINLSYCKITSPIDGEAGLIQVTEGNLIQSASDTTIVVINTFDPMTIVFSLPEAELPKVLKQFHKEKNLEVLAIDTQDQSLLASGKLYALDNQIDASTGTLKLKAIFDNKERSLFPNQFTNVKLLVDHFKEVIMVPIAAVHYDKNGQYLYKITAGNVATKVPVELGITKDDMILVTSGVQANDQVIVSGADHIRSGMTIKISQQNIATNAALAELECETDYQCAS